MEWLKVRPCLTSYKLHQNHHQTSRFLSFIFVITAHFYSTSTEFKLEIFANFEFFTDITSSGEDIAFRNVVRKLSEQNIDGLPPGGGLESK